MHSLLNTDNRDTLLVQPWVGASWEGFVIEQILGTLSASGKRYEAYYLRTSDQYEIDLVLLIGNEVWALEVKLTTNPGPMDLRRLEKTADLVGADRRFLVSQTQQVIEGDRTVSCSLPWLLDWLT